MSVPIPPLPNTPLRKDIVQGGWNITLDYSLSFLSVLYVLAYRANDIITTRFDIDTYNNITPSSFLPMLA